MSAFRSSETRRSQIRATNTGISAVVTPIGDLTETAGVHRSVALTASLTSVTDDRTLMLAWGDWFRPTCFALGSLLFVLSRIRG